MIVTKTSIVYWVVLIITFIFSLKNYSMYNCRYETLIDVAIQTENHDLCLDISKKIKYLCNAWGELEVEYTERKSANKGDVLHRYFMITQIGYSHNIIIFKESLNCILYYDIYTKLVTLNTRHTHPIDMQPL